VNPVEIATIFGQRYTATNKALQLQCTATGTGASSRTSWGDCFVGTWNMAAPPMPPTVDATGAASSGCEAAVVQMGDQLVALGQRDVRWSKYSQDVKPGEFAVWNAYGSRLYFGQHVAALNGGGAFLSFDLANQLVGLAGYPASAGAGAPYLSISTTSIGMVSATGAASLNVKADQVTASGAACALDVGSVTLGNGASDFVALASLVLTAITRLETMYNAHVHPVSGAATLITGTQILTPTTTVASTRVKSA